MAISKIVLALNLLIGLIILACGVVQASVNVDKYGEIDDTIEGFEKYCRLAKEAKQDYDSYPRKGNDDNPTERELREVYVKLNGLKLTLGSSLGITMCLNEAYEQVGQEKKHQLEGDFNAKCRQEEEAAVLCYEARQAAINSQYGGDVELIGVVENQFCETYKQNLLDRVSFGKVYDLEYCDPFLVNRVKQEKTAEAGRILSDTMKALAHGSRDKNSFKSKLSKLLLGCFSAPSDRKTDGKISLNSLAPKFV